MNKEQKKNLANAAYFAMQLETHDMTTAEVVGQILVVFGDSETKDEDFEEIVLLAGRLISNKGYQVVH